MNKKEAIQGFCAVLAYISSEKISFLEKLCVIGFVLAYIVSPLDLISDVPVFGWLDDIGVGALFIAFCNYRVNNLKAKDTEKNIIDVTPVEKTSIVTDKHLISSPKTTFSFSRKKNVSNNTGSGTK